MELLTPNNDRYTLNKALLSLSWEEHPGELAQRATARLANHRIGAGYLMTIVQLNCRLFIYATVAGIKYKVFEGVIFNWEYGSAQQQELNITANDPLINIQKSEDMRYYSDGMDTKAIIEDICSDKDWNIPLNYSWSKTIKHGKKAFKSGTVGNMILELLNEVKEQTDEKYVIFYGDGKMQISGYGWNKDIYIFDRDNTVSTSTKRSMDNLVTRVKIIGKENNDGRSPVEAVVDGRTEFGLLQKIISKDSNKSLDEAKKSAQTIIKDQGKPEETITVVSADLPFLRKGHKIRMCAGNLETYFHVVGVSHDAGERKMTMQLERIG